MENNEKCWLHHCICKIRQDRKSSRKPTASGKLAAMIQERGTSARRTQADHSRRESLTSSSSQEPSTPGNPAAMFSSGNEEPGNQFKSSIFKNADPSTLGRSLPEGNEDHLLSQARTEHVRKEHQGGSLNYCISELQQLTHAQRLELHKGYVESRREQVRLQEDLSMNEKVLRDTQIQSMHEMGGMKRAQEIRVDKVSVPRENHEIIQRLTSQIQEMQEQVNSLNDSGEFQDVESNYSGKVSHVPSQPAVIPSPRSMQSCDKRLPFDTWNLSGPQENVFGHQFSTSDSSRNHYQRIHHSVTPGATGSVPVHCDTGTVVARDEDLNKGTIPMPTFAGRPSTMSSKIPVEFPQNSMVGQQRQQISELQFDKFPSPQSFMVWKIRFKNQATTCSDFPSEAISWIKEAEMVDSLEEYKSSRSASGRYFQILRCWTRRLLLL